MTRTQVVEAYGEAWRGRDPGAIASHFAPEGVRRWEFVVPPVLDQPNSRQGPVIPIRTGRLKPGESFLGTSARSAFRSNSEVFIDCLNDLTVV